MKGRVLFSGFVLFFLLFLVSCSTTKFVPRGKSLLVDTKLKSEKKIIPIYELEPFIKQKPNFKTFHIFKVPLFIYNFSGQDSTKWLNRIIRKAGEPPVLFDSTQVSKTVDNLHQIIVNKGYFDVKIIPQIFTKNKKTIVTYIIKPGQGFYIRRYNVTIHDSVFSNIPKLARKEDKWKIKPNLSKLALRHSLVKSGNLFDLDVLDKERIRLSNLFRRLGYYEFNKEYVSFEADTTVGNHQADLTLQIHFAEKRSDNGLIYRSKHKQFIVKDIQIYVDYNPLTDGGITNYRETESFSKNNITIHYGKRGRYIKPNAILNNCYVRPGMLYDEQMTSTTYSALSELQILKNVNISYKEIPGQDSSALRCVITCLPNKREGISTEVGGTYSGGFFGVQSGVGYTHRNVFKGSELFNIKLNGSYEAMTPSFSSFGDNYFEIGGGTGFVFPRFLFPFLNYDLKRKIKATTELSANYTYQRRPGFFTRTILSSGLKYVWKDKTRTPNSHTLDLVNVSFVHVPNLDPNFYKDLSAAARYYSFTDQFILGTGYTFTRTNASYFNNPVGRSVYSLRASVESAGNLLAMVAKLAKVPKDSIGSRKIFGTRFVQYVRGTFDYSKTYYLDKKNSLAWRMGMGIAYPYGNFQQIPIEKRFFSGGADHVRGWDVQTLGPGSYYHHGLGDNFYNHSGDMRLDANIEYRSKLFWIFEMAAFVDAGNIWTLKDYPDQPGGAFKLNSFYKQIAVAWGLGLRLNFNFILLRLDCGWKAYDPSDDPNVLRWPIKEPYNFRQNVAWHIAVGYPF